MTSKFLRFSHQFYERFKVLIHNFSSLFILQLSNYILPLITIPYIVRIAGADLFGKISFASSVISYGTIVINFGFDYSATRRVAINRESNHLEKIFWSVLKIKFCLFLLTTIILFICFQFSNRMANDENLYLATFAVNLGYALFPSWFFQGVEKMAGMAIFNFIAKSIGALSVFIAFRERSDILIVPLSISLPNILVGVVAVLYVKRKYQFSFSFGSKDLLGPLIREGTPIFISTMLVTLYTTLNFVILGWFSSDLELGLFGGVYKIIMAIMMISQFPFNTSVFPFISRKTNLSSTGGILFFKRLVLVSFFFNALVSVVVYIFSEQIVLIVLGKDYQSAIGLLKIVSLLPLFVGVSSTLTIQGLYNFGLQRFNPYIGLTLAVICVSLNLIFIPQFGFKTAAWVWVFCQFLEIILVSVVLGLNRKMPFYWI